MVAVKVWTRGERGLAGKVVWKGEMAVIPRVGENVEVHDGWCSELVRQVSYFLHDGTVEIELETTDPNNEYPAVE